MRVIVTGAGLPLGRAIVAALLREPEVERILAVGGEAGDPRVVAHAADLGRSRDLRSLLFGPAQGFDAVVHSPLHAGTDEGRRVRALNVESTRELVHLLGRHPTIRHLVYRSFAEIYRSDGDYPAIMDEEHPLDLAEGAPQALRDRLEADMIACSAMGLSTLRIAVLRFAELYGPDAGGGIFDYLRSRVCFRPLGWDPMVQLLSVEDAARAVVLALRARAQGVFNVPGRDVLPLSAAIARAGRLGVPVPGPLLAPLYAARRAAIGAQFRYDLNRGRFHFGGVLDGRRARAELGYEPATPVVWP